MLLSLTYAILAHLLASITIAFVDPAALKLRYATLVLILAFLFLAIRKTEVSFVGEMFAMYMVGFGLHGHYFLCLMRLAIPQEDSVERELPAMEKWVWACKSLFTPRREILSSRKNTTASVPCSSQPIFLLRHCWSITWMFLAYRFITHVPLLYVILGESPDFSASKQSMLTRLGDLTVEEMLTRCYITFSSTLIAYISLAGPHSLCALTAVFIFKTSSPSDWRPLFGSITEAYSLRRWYAVFWHKLMRKGFTANAAWLIHSVVRIPKDAAFSRVAILLLCFAISGIMHAIAAWPINGRCASLTPMWYNFSFAGAIIAEDVVQKIYQRFMKEAGIRRSKEMRLVERLLGYAWVVVWFLETFPRAVYPGIRCRSGV